MRTLLFATTYIDSAHRARVLDHWLTLALRLNPHCDVLLVDSASPWHGIDVRHYDNLAGRTLQVHQFADNVGHLSRGGADGWGRAFCCGLDAAVVDGYDYVAHIEGDSLFRRPIAPTFAMMQRYGIDVASIPVGGNLRRENGWVETGLMFFDVGFLRHSKLTQHYDWQHRHTHPTPEVILFQLLGKNLRMLPFSGARADKTTLTPKNVNQFDWITHAWEDDALYDAFMVGQDNANSDLWHDVGG